MNLRTLEYIDKAQRQILENISKIKQLHNMNKFKKGDRVKIIRNGVRSGEEASINVYGAGISHVVFDDGEARMYSNILLEPVNPTLPSPCAADILAAAKANPCAEGVLKALYPDLFKDTYNKDKIYAANTPSGIRILSLKDNKYGFSLFIKPISGFDSFFGHDTPEKAIESWTSFPDRIKQFSTQREFLEWALEVTK